MYNEYVNNGGSNIELIILLTIHLISQFPKDKINDYLLDACHFGALGAVKNVLKTALIQIILYIQTKKIKWSLNLLF